MKYSVKAVLLSALIFPGLGQLLLKFYKTGVTIAAIAFTCMATVVTQAVSKAMSIAEQIHSSGAIPDTASIAESIQLSGADYDSSLINLAMLGLVSCWLVSVVHAYIAGRARDAAEAENRQ